MTKNIADILAPLSSGEFRELAENLEEFSMPGILAAFSSVGRELSFDDAFRLAAGIESFLFTDDDIVKMTVHENEILGGRLPGTGYDASGSETFAAGVRPTMTCMKDYPQYVLKLSVPEDDLSLPQFRFAVLRAREQDIPVEFLRAGEERHCGMCAVLRKYSTVLDENAPHVVLHHLTDMGNVGAIIRSALAFGYRDVALIGSWNDPWNPNVISTSRCANLETRIECFDSFEEYAQRFPDHSLYPLMLQASVPIDEALAEGVPEKYSIVLGNESKGLPAYFSELGKPVIIPIRTIDSLNVSSAAAISFYAFSRANNGRKLPK